MNRDTIYSGGMFDLSEPVTITLPAGDGRFQSMQVINQDHYTVAVEHDPGRYTLTRNRSVPDTRRCLSAPSWTPNDADDVARANALQDQIEVQQAAPGEFEVPDWDTQSLTVVRGMILALAATDPDGFDRAFGTPETVNPIQHLMGTAAGWGGNPREAAMYSGGFPPANDGVVQHSFTVNDVPVDGFWSVTVYNEDGFMEKNELDLYSFNGVTARPGADGSVTILFGGCDDASVNCIPITEGWNYVIRMYQPRQALLDGSWQFPAPEPVR